MKIIFLLIVQVFSYKLRTRFQSNHKNHNKNKLKAVICNNFYIEKGEEDKKEGMLEKAMGSVGKLVEKTATAIEGAVRGPCWKENTEVLEALQKSIEKSETLLVKTVLGNELKGKENPSGICTDPSGGFEGTAKGIHVTETNGQEYYLGTDCSIEDKNKISSIDVYCQPNPTD